MESFGPSSESSARFDPHAPGAGRAMLYGSVAFCVVSLLAYSIWAFRLVPGTAGLYSAIAAVYVGLAGVALSRLLHGRDAKRFPLLFAAAFLAYAVCWCAFWFGLNGKYHADLWGAAAGLAAMTWLIKVRLKSGRHFLPLFAVLFTCHTLGYTLGGELYALARGTTGRLLWGAAHGFGFGAGLGYVLWNCRSAAQIAVTSLGEESARARNMENSEAKKP
jgi:hypothetical protein